MNCKDCKWWKLIDEGDSLDGAAKGRCHGKAPTATAVAMPKINQIANTITPQIIEVTVWPVTGATCEACKDFAEILSGIEAN